MKVQRHYGNVFSVVLFLEHQYVKVDVQRNYFPYIQPFISEVRHLSAPFLRTALFHSFTKGEKSHEGKDLFSQHRDRCSALKMNPSPRGGANYTSFFTFCFPP